MKKLLLILFLLIGCFFVWAEGEIGHPVYVGYKKCQGCHRGERRAHVADKWEVSKHARAFEMLKEDEQKNPVCLQCHTTGYGEMEKGEYLEGVQCEACHGPGSEYKSGQIMNERRFEIQRDKQHKLALDAGLIVPTMKTCRRCHRTEAEDYKKMFPKERVEQR